MASVKIKGTTAVIPNGEVGMVSEADAKKLARAPFVNMKLGAVEYFGFRITAYSIDGLVDEINEIIMQYGGETTITLSEVLAAWANPKWDDGGNRKDYPSFALIKSLEGDYALVFLDI